MDRLMPVAMALVGEQGFASVDDIEQKMHIGHTRAVHIVEAMKTDGYLESVCDPAGRYLVATFSPNTFVFHCCEICKITDCLCTTFDGCTVGTSSVPPLHDGCECWVEAVMQ
jgi:hypothetical protein